MENSRVFKNASWIIGCKIAQSGFALVINALTARYFGPSNYGLINYAASLVAFVTPVAMLGMTEVLVDELIDHSEREGEILGTSIVMSVFSSILCLVGLGSFASIANRNDMTTPVVVALYSLLLISQSVEQIQYWFHAKYLSKLVSIASLIAYFAVSLYKIGLLVYRKNICWFAVSNSLDYLIIAVLLIHIYKHKGGQPLRFSWDASKLLWNKGKHYIIPGLMGLILAQSDRVMLRFMCGDTEVGYYSAALAVAGLTSFVFSAIITSFRTLVLESKAVSQRKYEVNISKLYGIIVYLGLLQCVFLTVFAKLSVQLMFGAEYLNAVNILYPVVWYTLFSYIGGVRAVCVLAEKKQRYLWIISASGMVLNIALNLALIPIWKGFGAAIATTVTQFFTNIIMVYLIRPLRPNLVYIIKGLDLLSIFNLKSHKKGEI